MIERLHFHFLLSCSGEGNGNPLQCSCLENPRDGGAWWAAVFGVAQSRARLKRLSSSSNSSSSSNLSKLVCPRTLRDGTKGTHKTCFLNMRNIFSYTDGVQRMRSAHHTMDECDTQLLCSLWFKATPRKGSVFSGQGRNVSEAYSS